MAEKVESSEGLMPKIRALLQPPVSEEPPGKGRGKRQEKENDTSAPWRSTNHDLCDFCGEGGDLLCCDRCPCAFHLVCCEPPVDPNNIPSGEWLCAKCRPAQAVQLEVIPPFDILIKQCLRRNPVSFQLPQEINCGIALPGTRKRRKAGDEARLRAASSAVQTAPSSNATRSVQRVSTPVPLDDHTDYIDGDRTVRGFCHVCNRTDRVGPMVFCDFCALVYHLDCLDPPLTNLPGTLWMCPAHSQHYIPDFHHPCISKRCEAADVSNHSVAQHTVLAEFVNTANRQGAHHREVKHTRRKTIQVPASVKEHYHQPMAMLEKWPQRATLDDLCCAAAVAERTNSFSRPIMYQEPWWSAQPPNIYEQDQWLDSVLHLQCDASRYSSLPAVYRQKMAEECAASNKPRPDNFAVTSSNSVLTNHCSEPSPLTADSPVVAVTVTGVPDAGNGSTGSSRASPGSRSGSPGVISEASSRANSPDRVVTSSPDDMFGSEEHASVSKRLKRSSRKLSRSESGRSTQRVPAALPRPPEDLIRQHRAIHNDHLAYALPDVERLDFKLVKLLATQRLQEILVSRQSSCESPAEVTPGCSTADFSQRSPQTSQHCQVSGHDYCRPSRGSSSKGVDSKRCSSACGSACEEFHWRAHQPHADELRQANALLCPVSGVGPVFPVLRRSISIGVGFDNDLCLRYYSPCQRLSKKHASVYYDEHSQQFELLSYSEYGVYVNSVLYGCDLSQQTFPSSPVPTPLLHTDHVRCFMGEGLRARRARQRVENVRQRVEDARQDAHQRVEDARQRWRQPHSLRYLSELLNYCEDKDDDETEKMDVDGSLETVKQKDPLPVLAGTAHRSQHTPSSSRPPHLTNDASLTWLQRQECTVRSGGFWLPEEAENDLPQCSCIKEDGFGCAVAGSVAGGWEGAAVLHHGTVVRFGCLAFVLSIAGQPGHDQLLRAILTVDYPSMKSSSLSKKEKTDTKS